MEQAANSRQKKVGVEWLFEEHKLGILFARHPHHVHRAHHAGKDDDLARRPYFGDLDRQSQAADPGQNKVRQQQVRGKHLGQFHGRSCVVKGKAGIARLGQNCAQGLGDDDLVVDDQNDRVRWTCVRREAFPCKRIERYGRKIQRAASFLSVPNVAPAKPYGETV